MSDGPGSPVGHLRRPDLGALRTDAVAGVPGAIASVPDGMASAALVGINPVYGLYASIAGPIAGGAAASTRLMVITTTTAAALAAASAVDGFSGDRRAEAVFLLTLIAGLLMVGAALLRLGRFVRFVSVSVLTGFLTAVAVNIVCGQLADLLGTTASGPFPLAKAWDVVANLEAASLASAVVGLGALAILAGLARTRLANYSAIVALLIPTMLALGSDEVAQVDDAGAIPTGIPLPHLPDLGLLTSPAVWAGAASVAVIVLVQGAGVAEVAPNPDGSTADANRDFMAQGIGNIASGLLRGQPVGGSVGQTALNIAAGARGRWAAVLSGVWMLVIVALFSGQVGHIAVPTLAAILIFAAVSSIRTTRIDTVLRTDLVSRLAFGSTFVATLVLPVAQAVGLGVVLSLILQLNREATDLRVVRLEPTPDGRLVESPAPAVAHGGEPMLLDVYGSLQFAGARTLQALLPDPRGSHRPAVILRLRGRETLGATALVVLADYADRLRAAHGRLFLSGVGPELAEHLRRTRRVDVEESVTVLPESPDIGGSTLSAYRAAQEWLRGTAA